MTHVVAISASIGIAEHRRFDYHQTVNVEDPADIAAAGVAAAIGEPARTRMLYCLMDGRARTSTELALVAGVSPSTASSHLNRLVAERLVKALAQGKHRYYSLHGPAVARVLEGLNVLAGVRRSTFVPGTPSRLRNARTCYDHMAGTVAVALHDRLLALDWLAPLKNDAYSLTTAGEAALDALGIDVAGARLLRRRFAYACVDWSERRPHLGGAIGAALLDVALRKRWVARADEGRELSVTALGVRELRTRLGVQ
jgi:DNA-binding transcriptional ArsR family regulator